MPLPLLDREVNAALTLQLEHDDHIPLVIHSCGGHDEEASRVTTVLHCVEVFRKGARGRHQRTRAREYVSNSASDNGAAGFVSDDLQPARLQALADLAFEVAAQVRVELDRRIRQRQLFELITGLRHAVNDQARDPQGRDVHRISASRAARAAARNASRLASNSSTAASTSPASSSAISDSRTARYVVATGWSEETRRSNLSCRTCTREAQSRTSSGSEIPVVRASRITRTFVAPTANSWAPSSTTDRKSSLRRPAWSRSNR